MADRPFSSLFLKAHAGQLGRAFTGEDQNRNVVAEFERVEDAHYLAVELDAGNAAFHSECNGSCFGRI
ncbi:MAG: hypothetical protein P8Y58_09070, partial [Novosphingobium sp.]